MLKRFVFLIVLSGAMLLAEYEVVIQAQKEVVHSVFDYDDISVSNALSLDDALDTVSGIEIHSYGGLGSLSSVNFHGSPDSEIAFAIEDVPLNSAQSGTFDLSLFPANLFNKISFIKGGASAIYGANASSGYLNLQLPYLQRDYIKVNLYTGSFQTWAGNVFYDKSLNKKISLSENFYIGQAKNNFPFTNNGIQSTRTNSQLHHLNSLTSLFYKSANIHSFVSVLLNHKKIGVPGAGYYQDTKAQQTDKNIFLLSKTQIFLPIYTEFLLSYYGASLHYIDPEYSFGLPIDSLHKNYQYYTKIFQMIKIPYGNIVYGLDEKFNGINSTEILNRNKNTISQFSSCNVYLWKNKIKLAARYKYDYNSIYKHILNYNIGYNIQLPFHFISWGNIGTAFREPTFNDLYWPDEGMAQGNPNLKPEFSHNYELGLQNKIGDLFNLKVSYYENFYTNIIAWASDGSKWMPKNFRRALYQGGDISGKIHWQGIAVNLNYSKLYPRILSHDQYYNKFIPNQPFDKINCNFKFQYKFIFIVYEYDYTGFSYTTANNTISDATINEAYSLMNAGFGVSLKHFFVQGKINNFLNTSYQTQKGYPMPGINFLLTMSYQYDFKGGKSM